MKLPSFSFFAISISTLLFCSCDLLETPKTSGFSCKGGCCDWVDENADYTFLQDCENACGGFPLVDYMVWTDIDLGCFPIEVKMVGQSGGGTQMRYLTAKTLGGAPDCGDLGPANFGLLPGIYDIEATCSSGKKWTKRVSVSKFCCDGWKIN